jgi:hypothetical protein
VWKIVRRVESSKEAGLKIKSICILLVLVNGSIENPKSLPVLKEADRIVAPLKNAACLKVKDVAPEPCELPDPCDEPSVAGPDGGGARVEIAGLLIGCAACPLVIV